MKSALSEDSDEEYSDDPIKLFESDENAVYFGSHQGHSTRNIDFSWKSEQTVNDAIFQPRENSILRPSELTDTSHSSECDFPQSCVKLVDCGKFPWYFRKYTQQILHKTILNLSSDSDSEIDVVGIEDCNLSDCFIVEDLQDVSSKFRNDVIKESKTKLQIIPYNIEKRLNNIKRREDFEIQKALCQKNIAKLDLKRNQGLVGMKIKQKVVKNEVLDSISDRINGFKDIETKQICTTANEIYINAADITLSNIGTQLIPILENTDGIVIGQSKNTEEKEQNVGIEKLKRVEVPVNCSSGKGFHSKKIRPNESVLKYPEHKSCIPNDKVSKSSKTDLTVKSTHLKHVKKTNCHVKDVMKTNKFKNDQIKKQNKTDFIASVASLLLKQNKMDTKELKFMKQKNQQEKVAKQRKVAGLNKKPHKKVDKHKREPISPILPCGTLLKKIQYEIPPNCNKSDAKQHISKEVDHLNKIVKKLTKYVHKSKSSQNNKPKHTVISKAAMDATPTEAREKLVSQKESCIIQDKSVNKIHVEPMKLPAKDIKNCNLGHKTNYTASNSNNGHTTTSYLKNKTPIEQNLKSSSDTCQDNVNNLLVKIVSAASVGSPNIPIKNDKPTGRQRSTIMNVPTCEENQTANISNQCANFTNSFTPNLTTQNDVPRKPTSVNLPNSNVNVPVENRYIPPLILKPNHQINFKVGNYQPHQLLGLHRPTRDPNRSTTVHISVPTQPRLRNYHNPHPGYYQSAPSNRYQNYLSRSVNSAASNRIPAPNDICPHLSNRTPSQFHCKSWLSQNLAPPPPPPPPPPSPPPPLLPLPLTSPRSTPGVSQILHGSHVIPTLGQVSQQVQDTCNQNFANTSSQDSSIIGRNNEGLVKKINIFSIPKSTNDDSKEVMVKLQKQIPDSQFEHNEKFEVVSTKTEMLEELDKLSFVDDEKNDLKRRYQDSTNDIEKVSTFKMDYFSKKPNPCEALKYMVNKKNYDTRIEEPKGYSPPILPIPTYQKVLDVISVTQSKNENNVKLANADDSKLNLEKEIKPVCNPDADKFCKRKLSHELYRADGDGRKDDAKKISLEEYKKRIFKNDSRSEQSIKKAFRGKDSLGKRPNIKYKENADYSAETDLGYDSDSTVVL